MGRIDDPTASVVPEPNPFVEGPAASPGVAPATTQGRTGSIDLLMTACGLGAVTLTDAQAAVAAERAGHLLRIAIDGMLQMLAGRSVAKQEFGLERTIISRGANNPLKFVTTADEALKLLLCGDLPGFLGAEDAMRETITDIKSHQLALLSGIQAAFAETLNRLDPASVERAVPRRPADRVMPARRAARVWKLYQTLFAELQSSLADDRRDGFGSEFARAYASVQSAARSLKGEAAAPSHEP
jgi:type VI secretion system protein